ncbi:MAG: PepSY-associated TM helix domain-containing protein [Polaromonas sp.]|nr:PepSY-associated TM helix domain-containing protein [Polaromonas sp.]
MKEGFRQSMAFLHTWTGLLVGWVLFMIFAAGTASYFKDEISFWMKPELHQASRGQATQVQAAESAIAALQKRGADSPRWFIDLPSDREPAVRMLIAPVPKPVAPGEKPRRQRFTNVTLDAATGEVLDKPRETRGGEFLYRLHFDLHYMPALWARWIVGFCAMFMLVAILSGIVTHKRIFKDFFTFRPKKGQRSWLDAHNATAVLALPYHLMITYTGLVTLMFMYMPWATQVAYKGDNKVFQAEVFPAFASRNVPRADKPAALTPIAPLVEQATAHWGGASVGRVVVTNPNDANASITLTRQDSHTLSYDQPSMTFNGTTGALVSTFGDTTKPAAETRGVLYGLHVGRFGDPLMRWLFFFSGLAGTVMVATGLLLWAVKERQKYAKALAKGGRVSFGLWLVDGLNVGAIAGLPMAIAAYFWANRLVPLGIAERPQTEINLFFLVWGLATVAGLAWPKRRMWQAQLLVGGALFAGVPVLNAFTTATHLGVTIPAGMWNVAGLDLVCLALGLCLFWAAWWIGRKKPVKAPRTARVSDKPQDGIANGDFAGAGAAE